LWQRLALLAQVVVAQITIFFPFGNDPSGFDVLAKGTGTDGQTTYVATATNLSDPNIAIPTITFVEGASSVVVPTQTFKEVDIDGPSSQAMTITVIAFQSCGVARGGVATCIASEEVKAGGKTTTVVGSAVTETFEAVIVTSSSGAASASNTASSASAPSTGATPGFVLRLQIAIYVIVLLCSGLFVLL